MKMKTLSAELNEFDTRVTVLNLIKHSRWFEVDPQPDDIWAITVKDEHPNKLRFPEGTKFYAHTRVVG